MMVLTKEKDGMEDMATLAPVQRDSSHYLPIDASREEAFSEIVEDFSGPAYRIAIRILRDPTDAEDAVQEAFLSAYRALPRFKGDSKVSTWLYRIVVNACLLKIRKEKTRSKYLTDAVLDDGVLHSWKENPEKAAINGELSKTIQDGLGGLPPQLRDPVILRNVQGFSNVEAAKILDITVPALKARLHRGHVLLRRFLQRYLDSTVSSSNPTPVPAAQRSSGRGRDSSIGFDLLPAAGTPA